MSEFLSHPAFLPALIGFLAGIFLTFFFLSSRLSALRTAALKQEKKAAQTIAHLKIEESTLQAEIANLRTSESLLIKQQEELEGLHRSEQEKKQVMSEHLSQAEAILRDGMIKLESTVLNAIRKSRSREDLNDFVPHITSAKETPREEQFEGFTMEQSHTKAESAANVLRAALDSSKL